MTDRKTVDELSLQVKSLCENLRRRVDSGRRTLGGGSISHDGVCSMYGNEPIMILKNPDGPEAANLIENLFILLTTSTPFETSGTENG